MKENMEIRISNNQHGISNVQPNSQDSISNNPSRFAGSREAGEYPTDEGKTRKYEYPMSIITANTQYPISSPAVAGSRQAGNIQIPSFNSLKPKT